MVLPQDCQILTVRQLHSNERNRRFPCLCIKIRAQRGTGTHNVAGFTVGFLLHSVERLSPQLVVAHHAGETLHVEDLVHGRAPGAFSNHILPAAGTASCHRGKDRSHSKALVPGWGCPSTHLCLHSGSGGRGSSVHRKNNLCHCWQRSITTGRHSGAGPYEKI